MRAARTAHRAAHRATHHGARRATGAVVLATILALLAACTDGATHERPVPTTITTTAQSPTPSPTPEPTPVPTSASGLDFSDIDLTVPPPRPAALDEGPSPEAADAIARYFMLLFPYMYVTHDLDAFDALSHSTCEYCQTHLETVRQYIHDDVQTERGAFIIGDTSVETFADNYYIATMNYSQDWSQETDSDGSVVAESPGFDRFTVRIHVVVEDGAWKIAGVSRPRS